jgi:hypothetical protein
MVVSGRRNVRTRSPLLQGVGALLCLIVAAIHVVDQSGFPGSKGPGYIAVSYYLLEVAAIVAAVLLLRSGAWFSWLLSAGVALGPLVGYILSRGPGLPSYSEDRGNWMEPLGVASLVVEGLLLTLAVAALATARQHPR